MQMKSATDSTNYSNKNEKIKVNGTILAICFILIILIIIPLVAIFSRSVYHDGVWDFSNALSLITDSSNVITIMNTLLLSVSVVIASTLIALPLAFLTARTTFAKYKWLDIVLIIPFMTPPYIASMGWILFTQRRGLFQQLFPGTGYFSEDFISFVGLVLVMSFHLFPFMLTIIKNSLLNIGANLEESATVFGGKFGYRLRRVILPLVSGSYAVGALLVFIKAASEFGTPFTIGRRIGFPVFVTEIQRSATVAPIDFGRAASLSAVLVGICIFTWFIQSRISIKRNYQLIGGKGTREKFIKLKGWKAVLAWSYIGLVLLIAIAVPYFSVITTSFINLRGFGMVAGNFTLNHYINLFTNNPRGISAFTNSLFLGITSATGATLLGLACATIIHYTKSKSRQLISIIGLLPDMLPSIVLVIGIMIFWNAVFGIVPLYNTIWILVIAYIALFLPFTIQSVSVAYSQISDNLVNAGKIFGGSKIYIFKRITLPLLFRSILVGWMMTFIIAFRELVTASIIAPPNTPVVSTFIMREFEQGSVSVGMAMAVVSVLFTTIALIFINHLALKGRGEGK